MATIPQVNPALLTIEEYLHTSYRPDVDFVDDHIEERNLGEFEHSRIQIAIGTWFMNHEKEWNIRTFTEYRTRVSQTRVRIPDVAITRKDHLREKVRTSAALLCIEILSPEDRIPRVVKRLNEFLAMGVENIWLFDPMERAAMTYTAQGLRLVEADRITIDDSPIYVDLPHIFSALD